MRVYKDNVDILGETILVICNTYFSQGIFPDHMKIAKVLLYKAGDKNKSGNYRPIPILGSYSKIVVIQLNSYLNDNSILSNYRFGV